MPLFHHGQAFYVHIPRCGGTSIEKELGIPKRHLYVCKPKDHCQEKDRLCNTPALGKPMSLYELDHPTAAMILARVPDLERKYVFAVVRNPYDRLGSEFCYQQAKGARIFKSDNLLKNFDHFVRVLHNKWPTILEHDNHWKVSHLLPQHLFVDGLPNVHLYRTETLARDWQNICYQLHQRIRPLPHLNVSQQQPRYTQELADLVYTMYEQDFLQFGYNRDSWKPKTVLRHVLIDNAGYAFHHETLESILGEMLPALAWPHRVSKSQTRFTLALHGTVATNPKWASLLAYLKRQWNDRLTLVFGQQAIPHRCDLHIFATVYPNKVETLRARAKAPLAQCRYIMHRFDNPLVNADHCFWLAPHLADPWYIPTQLPFADKPRRRPRQPVIVVQGSLQRRDWAGLVKLLTDARPWYRKFPFTVRIVGKGKALPPELLPFRAWIDLRLNPDFVSFHRAFDDACAVLPCINHLKEPTYFTSRLSSSISYALAYRLALICNRELADLYHIPDRQELRQVIEDYYIKSARIPQATKTLQVIKTSKTPQATKTLQAIKTSKTPQATKPASRPVPRAVRVGKRRLVTKSK